MKFPEERLEETEEGNYRFDFENLSLKLSKMERSLREQRFEEYDSDTGSFKMKRRGYDGFLRAEIDFDDQKANLDLGESLSSMREIELCYSVLEGHLEGTDSILELVNHEINPTYVSIFDL